MELSLIFLAAYLIGSIPFGLILTRMAGLGDIRTIGSGNIGATNVLRTGNKKLAALTLFLDGFKGWLAVFLAGIYLHQSFPAENCIDCAESVSLMFQPAVGFVALTVVLGHMFPIWLKFKGGKGVATAFGAALGLNFFVGIAACLTWLIIAIIFRYSSLSALVAIAALPGFALYLLEYGINYALPLTLIAVLVWIRHHENIKRLLNGSEPKIGQKK